MLKVILSSPIIKTQCLCYVKTINTLLGFFSVSMDHQPTTLHTE